MINKASKYNSEPLSEALNHLVAPEDVALAREALLRYCELDTLAMVKVWEK